MSISVEARVWLATHLLYPNSTQAFDVYQAIVSQSDRAIQNGDFKKLIKALAQICDKIPPVSSNLLFHVFENKPIGEWPVIYKKTQRIQQVIFIGVLIFDLSVEDVAKVLKMSFDRTRFLFHQSFKKVVQHGSDIKEGYSFKFKKSADKNVSYLYTNESLIEYALGHLSPSDIQKVKDGLQSYPVLQVAARIYEKIIKEIKDLLKNHENFAIEIPKPQTFPKTAPRQTIRNSIGTVNKYKKPISISSISMIVLVIIFIRPRWIENMSDNEKNEAIVLLELKKSQIDFNEIEVDQAPINLNELPIQSVQKEIQSKEKAKPVAAVAVVEDKKPIAIEEKQAPKPNPISEPKKQGGLYRGVLYVTDLEEVTPKLVDKIVSYGGKKAGEVELGWRKNEKLGYYHFTLPQDNVTAVNEFLGMFGKYKIEFENHPRLVSPGLKRFIIEVKESD